MPEDFETGELPILAEIGEALYRAAVADDARVGRRLPFRLPAALRAPGGRDPDRRRRWSRGPLIGLAALVGTSATVGGMALAGVFDGGRAVTPDQFAAGARPVPPAIVTPGQAASLAILRRAPTAADALPRALAAGLARGAGIGANGPNVTLARRAQGLAGGAVWVVPAAGGVCLIASSTGDVERSGRPGTLGGATCAPNAAASAGRMIVLGAGAGAPGVVFLAGLVPDGVAAVDVDVAGGRTQAVAVVENAYVATLRGAPTAVSFTGPAGAAVTVAVPATQHHPYVTGRGNTGP